MAQSYFIWKGIDCRTKGIIMQEPAPIIIPEERVKNIEIPGKAGDETMIETRNEGEAAYNSYIQTVRFAVEGTENAKEAARWLRWSGYVTFSTDPEKRQQARVIGAVTLNKHSYNHEWYEGEVQFYCQPFKERLAEVPQTILYNHAPEFWKVTNNGDIWARYPQIKLLPFMNRPPKKGSCLL